MIGCKGGEREDRFKRIICEKTYKWADTKQKTLLNVSSYLACRELTCKCMLFPKCAVFV